MLNMFEVIETNNMIEHEKLDVAYHYHGHQSSGLLSMTICRP